MANAILRELLIAGWQLRPKNFQLAGWHSNYLLFKNRDCLLILDSTTDRAQITADLLGPYVFGFCKLYYGHINNKTQGRIRGLYQWSLKNHIQTICL
tara:strand:- start:1759 stop:2049 length:291 start_codon:yes stop_codon:yes gene_type:complete